MEVRKATISVALAKEGRTGEVCHLGNFPNRGDHIGKLAERLSKNGQQLRFCYEAGPCGYGLYRQLTELGHECMVYGRGAIADSDKGWRPDQDRSA